MLLQQFVSDLLGDAQSDDVEADQQVVPVVRYMPVSVWFAPASQFEGLLMSDPQVDDVEVLVGNIAFTQLVED